MHEAVHDAVVQAIEENVNFDVRANLYTLVAVTGVVRGLSCLCCLVLPCSFPPTSRASADWEACVCHSFAQLMDYFEWHALASGETSKSARKLIPSFPRGVPVAYQVASCSTCLDVSWLLWSE